MMLLDFFGERLQQAMGEKSNFLSQERVFHSPKKVVFLILFNSFYTQFKRKFSLVICFDIGQIRDAASVNHLIKQFGHFKIVVEILQGLCLPETAHFL